MGNEEAQRERLSDILLCIERIVSPENRERFRAEFERLKRAPPVEVPPDLHQEMLALSERMERDRAEFLSKLMDL